MSADAAPRAGALPIRSQAELDLLSLGALVTRLDPGLVPFAYADRCEIHVSGGEYNVAANLAACFRMRTAVASAMVDYPIGELIARKVRAMGVRGIYRHFEHDGVRGPNMATVYSDRGIGVRPPVVFYNRANEAGALLAPGDFDWDALFRPGVRWFHTGGIFASLSDTTSALILDGIRAARTAGAIVSLDLNFRQKLWSTRGGQSAAQQMMSRIVEGVDVLVGNEEDLQKGLGITGPEAASNALDPSAFLAMIERVHERYPNVRVVATTLREVRSASRHGWSAVAWIDGEAHVAPTIEVDVYDRVGGGDGFAAGFFYGLMSGASYDEALRLGWAHGALLATYPGDTTMASLEQVQALAHGGSARIQR